MWRVLWPRAVPSATFIVDMNDPMYEMSLSMSLSKEGALYTLLVSRACERLCRLIKRILLTISQVRVPVDIQGRDGFTVDVVHSVPTLLQRWQVVAALGQLSRRHSDGLHLETDLLGRVLQGPSVVDSLEQLRATPILLVGVPPDGGTHGWVG